MSIWNTEEQFLDAALAAPEIRELLGEDEVRACFDLKQQLRNVDVIFARVLDA